MANINRPKYQAGGRVSPYQLADIVTAPKKTEMEVFFDKFKSAEEMQLKKISFDKELREEFEKLQREAKKKSGKHKGLFKAIDLIGMATGTSPLTSAVTGYGRAADYKKAIGGMRLGEDWTGRTKGTFLAPTSRGYQKEIEALRGSINPLEAALMSGLSSLLTQKISGGEFGKSPLKNLFGDKSADVAAESVSVDYPTTTLPGTDISVPSSPTTLFGKGTNIQNVKSPITFDPVHRSSLGDLSSLEPITIPGTGGLRSVLPKVTGQEHIAQIDKGGPFKNLFGSEDKILAMLPFFAQMFGEGTYANVPEIQY